MTYPKVDARPTDPLALPSSDGSKARIAELERQARKCRQLAAEISDEPTIARLTLMADQYDSEVRRLRDEG